ncbi:MAG: transposase, partial [Patescibacteria group bacterium]
ASRLQLLVEGLQRVERILNESDRARLAESFAPYIRDSAGHYTYRVKGKEAIQEHLQRIGQSIHTLLQDLRPTYAAETAFQVLERLFTENFNLVESQAHPKANEEIRSGCLQSVDDLEATYRTKGNAHYKGYVANLTETCDPQNEIQLITKVQVAANNIDDSQLLADALPNLQERTEVDTLVTDGGYGGEASDKALQDTGVTLIQTAIRGRSPSTDKLHLSDFIIKFNPQGKPSKITCPQGQMLPVHTSSQQKAFVAHFDPAVCQTCPLHEHCPSRPGKRDPRLHLRFTQAEARAAERRRLSQAHAQDSHNLRSAVEASVRSIKHPFPAGKLPVRGKFRMTCMIIASAAMTNVRRIQRYTTAKIKAMQTSLNQKDQPMTSQVPFFAAIRRFLAGRLCPRPDYPLVVGC